MLKIRKFLRKEVKNNGILITEEDKLIIEKLVDFYFNGVLTDDIDELNLQRVKVKLLLDIPFYKEVGREIERVRIAKALEEKQKSFDVIKILLSNDIKSFEELSEITNLSVLELKKIFENQQLFLEYGEDVFVSLGEKISVLEEYERQIVLQQEKQKREDEKKMKNFKQIDDFLWIYLNSRYRNSDITNFANNYIKRVQAVILKDEYRENYPEDIIDRLRLKGDELKFNKERGSNVVVRDYKIIKIVKPEIIQVSQYILGKLELVASFFENFGNIEKMAGKSKNFPSYNSVLSSLMLPELEDYLTEEAYFKLNKYLNIEKNYQSLNYVKRLELVRDSFIKYSGNLYRVVENKDEEEIALRMLSDKLVKQIAGEEIYNKVLAMLDSYSDKRYVIDELIKNKVNVKKIDN